MFSIKKILSAFIISLMAFKVVAKNNEFKVLAYHSVVDESAAPSIKRYYPQTIPASMLINQFNWFKANGFNMISWQQVLDAKAGKSELPDNAVLLSFDDGYETMYSTIYPLLKAYNYPAVFAPVSSWINAPANSYIQYGSNAKLHRSAFTEWSHIAEMRQSGLVEIASHTDDLHYGINATPAGNQIPAVISPRYHQGKYETLQQYHQRLQKDLAASSRYIANKAGLAPRVMVWPYGQYNEKAIKTAQDLGMSHHFSLNSQKINTPDDPHVGRLLLDAETKIEAIEEYLTVSEKPSTVTRSLEVSLDDIYHPTKATQDKNIDSLVQQIYDLGVNTVYLKAYSAQNHHIDAVYFPNNVLPVKADLFTQIAWQLRMRVGIKVLAAFPLDSNLSDKAQADLFESLSFHAKFDGVYLENNLPLSQFDSAKQTQALAKIAVLRQRLEPYFGHGKDKVRFTLQMPLEGEEFTSQTTTLDQLRPHFAKIAFATVPEAVKQAGKSLNKLPPEVKSQITFEFQPSSEKPLTSAYKQLEKWGIYSFGYTPQNILTEQGVLKAITPVLSANSDPLK